jgi:hypothetical protein
LPVILALEVTVKKSDIDDPPLFKGGSTWIDRDYDPYFQKKVKFARTKAAWLWFRDNVLAKVLISILSLIAAFFLYRWLNTIQPQNQPAKTQMPESSHQVSRT